LRIILFYQFLLGCDSVTLVLRLSGSSAAITSSIDQIDLDEIEKIRI
jgi:hypothetical protein